MSQDIKKEWKRVHLCPRAPNYTDSANRQTKIQRTLSEAEGLFAPIVDKLNQAIFPSSGKKAFCLSTWEGTNGSSPAVFVRIDCNSSEQRQDDAVWKKMNRRFLFYIPIARSQENMTFARTWKMSGTKTTTTQDFSEVLRAMFDHFFGEHAVLSGRSNFTSFQDFSAALLNGEQQPTRDTTKPLTIQPLVKALAS